MDKIKRINVYPSAEAIDLGGIVDIDPPVHEPVDIVFVPNAYIGRYGHITRRFKNIEMVGYPQHRGLIGIKGMLSNYFLKTKTRVDRPAVSIISGWSDGFYHFTVESLLKLYVLREHIEGATIVLPVKPPKFQLEWMDILGYTDITYVGLKELVFTPLAISSSFPASSQNHHNIILPEFRAWILANVKGRSVLNSRKIFVGRPAGSKRNLINQEELASVLEERGFESILMEDFSLADQINIFKNADEIVAVHGAALANLAFCSPGTKVLDLIHENYDQQCFLKLSRIIGLDYHRSRCTGGPATKEHVRFHDYTANTNAVLTLLDKW
jgi:capsular polysaccharide biosynthesis protein